MINRLPYEIIAIEANKLIVRMALSEDSLYYQNLYHEFLSACGWDDASFDKVLLNNINMDWEKLLQNTKITECYQIVETNSILKKAN